MKKIIIGFFTGTVISIVILLILSLALGIVADANRFSDMHFHLFGLTILQVEVLEPKGHMLSFGVGVPVIGLLMGIFNGGLVYYFQRSSAQIN